MEKTVVFILFSFSLFNTYWAGNNNLVLMWGWGECSFLNSSTVCICLTVLAFSCVCVLLFLYKLHCVCVCVITIWRFL